MNCPYCKHELTTADARSIRAALNASERKTKSGGKAPSCTCGECKKCRKREQMRKYRADRQAAHSVKATPKKK